MKKFKVKHFKKEETFSKEWFMSYLMVIFGSMLLSFAIVFFIAPYNLVPGGVFGLSIVINHLIGIPIGTIALIINIPLLIWGIKILGANFGMKTFLSMILTSSLIDGFTYFFDPKPLADNILVASIFGGVLVGTSISLVIRAGATTGGTDIVARIISKYTKIPVGKMFLAVDGCILLSGLFVFKDINMIPYALIAIFSISKTIDAILNGLDNKKAVFIISEKHKIIRKYILEDIDRGGTYLKASGLYFTEEARNVIFTVLNRREQAALENQIKKIDPKAFMMTVNTHEVVGSGFKPFES